MSTFTASVQNSALPAGGVDIMTLVPAANRRIWITELSVCGMGTSSAASEIDIDRITTAGGTSSGTITPAKFDFYAPAPATVVNSGWTTQPVVGTVPIVALGVNANGGIYRWTARPGQEINSIGGTVGDLGISIRCKIQGGGNYTTTVTWQEDPI